MYLHENKELFKDLINKVYETKKIDTDFIKKDYYVVLLLRTLISKDDNFVFKGGTSLSKCYQVINRFSEDIDLNYSNYPITKSKGKSIKNEIIEVTKQLKFSLEDEYSIKSGRKFNQYNLNANIDYKDEILKSSIIVETAFFGESFPTERKEINSMIYDYLKMKGEYDNIIQQYNLKPFSINVQCISRTFIDKVFAICDYAISKDITRNSRHLYDIYKLYPFVEINQIQELIKDVRKARAQLGKCYSCKANIIINVELQKIIDSEIYKNDYNKITRKLLTENVEYEECIETIKKIIKMNIF